jgi:hypothetical protein
MGHTLRVEVLVADSTRAHARGCKSLCQSNDKVGQMHSL